MLYPRQFGQRFQFNYKFLSEKHRLHIVEDHFAQILDSACDLSQFEDTNPETWLDQYDCGSKLLHALRLAGNGHYKAAAQELEEIHTDVPKISFYRDYYGGACWFKLNELKKAMLAFGRALKILPDHYYLRLCFGMVCHILGLVADANTHWWAAYRTCNNVQIRYLFRRYFVDQHHPEKLALYPLCKGKGIDVGCGSRKTHPNAIGVDIRGNGEVGTAGCEAGRSSQADIAASGDNLAMFRDAELDYVIQRHNLEHYQDPVKTLEEWKRVLKPGGLLGMVVPDDAEVDTIRLDDTHKHVFTQESMARLLHLLGGFEILHMDELLHKWSFVCIAQRIQDKKGQANVHRYDYQHQVNLYRVDMLKRKAFIYHKEHDHHLADQCLQAIELFSSHQP